MFDQDGAVVASARIASRISAGISRSVKAREVAAVGQGLPDAVTHFVRQALVPRLIEGDEGQVGRRVHGDDVAGTLEGLADARGGLDGGLADRQVEAVLEERLELDPEQAPLGQERAVDEKLEVTLAAHRGELLELLEGVEGAVLGGLGHIDIDEGGGDHVVARAVALPRRVDAFDVGGVDLAVHGRGVEDLVAAALDDAGLVHVDVAGVGGDDALPGQEDRVDDGGVRLGAADQEVHVGVGGLAGLADQVAGTLAVLVGAVSAGLLHVRGDESLKHPGVRTLLVIAGKVRQRMGRTHAAIIPRAWPDDSRFLMKIFSSWNRGTILTVAGRCCRASQYESEGIA